MSRAFILLSHERREKLRPQTWPVAAPDPLNDEGGHEVPVRFQKDRESPVVTTTLKVVIFLITYTSALVVVVAFVFKFLVAGEVTALKLELMQNYRRVDQAVPISPEATARIRVLEDQVGQLSDRVLALEGRERDRVRNSNRTSD